MEGYSFKKNKDDDQPENDELSWNRLDKLFGGTFPDNAVAQTS
jgi:hypothetical protein